MKRRRWHRVVKAAVALSVVTILTAAFLAQPALAASQTWYMLDTAGGTADYVMQRGSGTGTGPITVANGASIVFEADEAVTKLVSFGSGDWTGQITATPDSVNHTATVEIGSWNGTVFSPASPAGTSGTMTFPAKGAASSQPFTITDASAFDVTQGSWLALRFNNLIANKTIDVATDGTSYVTSPTTDPGYPYIWESYDDAVYTNVWGTVGDPYASETSTTTAWMYGTNFTVDYANYSVGYYDGNGTKRASYSVGATGDKLSSNYVLTSVPTASPGTWHAVVFDAGVGTPPNTYAECSGAPGYTREDDFEVATSAIPEFPTVLAAIVVAGLCFGAYYWMRKRKLAYAKA